jgi:hypothetical protein
VKQATLFTTPYTLSLVTAQLAHGPREVPSVQTGGIHQQETDRQGYSTIRVRSDKFKYFPISKLHSTRNQAEKLATSNSCSVTVHIILKLVTSSTPNPTTSSESCFPKLSLIASAKQLLDNPLTNILVLPAERMICVGLELAHVYHIDLFVPEDYYLSGARVNPQRDSPTDPTTRVQIPKRIPIEPISCLVYPLRFDISSISC